MSRKISAHQPRLVSCDVTIRSRKEFSMRMTKHGVNALRLSAWLASHPRFERVRYPGLKSDRALPRVQERISHNATKEFEYLGWEFPHRAPSVEAPPQRTLAHDRTLEIPFGSMVTFAVQDATVQDAENLCTSLEVPTLAESLGGVETLVEALLRDDSSASVRRDQSRAWNHAQPASIVCRPRGHRGLDF
ncbi:hypothetical protein IAU59_003441 [Kwoniella sp. CBS 9459]